MKHTQLSGISIIIWSAVAIAATETEIKPLDTSRIVTLSGAITETVFALGAGDRVVGVDVSSSYPDTVNQLPKVAYHRRLSAEGVLSLAPTLVIATSESGPPEAVQQLEQAGVALLIVPYKPTVESTLAKIERIATALGTKEAGDALIARTRGELDQARLAHPTEEAKSRVLFIYARSQGTLMVAGQGTGADAIIALAGGINAAQGYVDYKPLTTEAVIAAAPDVILLMDSGLESIGGPEGLWQLPGLSLTPAGKQGRVLSLDGLLLLGFGPRLGQAALALNRSLYANSKVHGRE